MTTPEPNRVVVFDAVLRDADQLAAVAAVEDAAYAALAYVHDKTGNEVDRLLEATQRLCEYTLQSTDVLAALLKTFAEALASADILGERLGARRGATIDGALEGLRKNYLRRMVARRQV